MQCLIWLVQVDAVFDMIGSATVWWGDAVLDMIGSAIVCWVDAVFDMVDSSTVWWVDAVLDMIAPLQFIMRIPWLAYAYC